MSPSTQCAGGLHSGDKIIGLSKINRIVRFFAQRPQVQERLTRQILVALQTLLETEDAAVTINAVHYCGNPRGDGHQLAALPPWAAFFKSSAATAADFPLTTSPGTPARHFYTRLRRVFLWANMISLKSPAGETSSGWVNALTASGHRPGGIVSGQPDQARA